MKELTAEGGLTLASALFEVQMPWLYIALSDKRTTEKQESLLGGLCCLYLLFQPVKCSCFINLTKKRSEAVSFLRSIP